MSCPLHLTLNLDERLSYMATLPPSPTHVATSSVARILLYINSQNPSNICWEQHMLGSIELQPWEPRSTRVELGALALRCHGKRDFQMTFTSISPARMQSRGG